MLHILLIFWKIPTCVLHGLIPSCTFINFGKFQAKTFIFTNKKGKIPTCTALFQPARLLIFGILPACTFIPSCTIIRETRVLYSRVITCFRDLPWDYSFNLTNFFSNFFYCLLEIEVKNWKKICQIAGGNHQEGLWSM